MKYLTLFFLLVVSLYGEFRYRHVAEAWNTRAVAVDSNMFNQANSWHYLDWFGTYYQTDWWIYHCDKGWLYPEGDNNVGVWFFEARTNRWAWTRSDVYPLAWDHTFKTWFNFCVPSQHTIERPIKRDEAVVYHKTKKRIAPN